MNEKEIKNERIIRDLNQSVVDLFHNDDLVDVDLQNMVDIDNIDIDSVDNNKNGSFKSSSSLTNLSGISLLILCKTFNLSLLFCRYFYF